MCNITVTKTQSHQPTCSLQTKQHILKTFTSTQTLTPTHPTSGSQNHAHPHPSTAPKIPTKPTYQPPYSQKPLGSLRQGLAISGAPSQSLKLCKQTVQALKPPRRPSNKQLPHISFCNQSKGSCPLTGKHQPAC